MRQGKTPLLAGSLRHLCSELRFDIGVSLFQRAANAEALPETGACCCCARGSGGVAIAANAMRDGRASALS